MQASWKLCYITFECKLYIELKKRGFEIVKKNAVFEIAEESFEEPAEFNKGAEFYFSSFKIKTLHSKAKWSQKNPFACQFYIDQNRIETLVDTGADVSLISLDALPKNIPITKLHPAPRIKSASNNYLEIVGEIPCLKLDRKSKKYRINVLVTKNTLGGIILGTNFISKYPDIIGELLKNKCNERHLARTYIINSITALQPSINNLLAKFSNLFQTELSQYTLCTRKKHYIDTGTHRPSRQFSSRIPINVDPLIQKEVDRLLSIDIIKKSNSKWSSRLVPILKPDGSLRQCIDYRHINNLTVKDKYPLPLISDILDKLSGKAIFSTLDATSGYYQLAMDAASAEKTAFIYKGICYEFKRMPFGLCNAPATFQSLMDDLFSGDAQSFVLPYLDDIIIFSNTSQEHLTHVEYVLSKLKGANIILNKNKCKFFKEKIKILGNIVSKDIIAPDPDKTKAIFNYKKPENIKQLRSFLGLANQTRDYIVNYAKICEPLTSLLKGHTKRSIRKIDWTERSTPHLTTLRKTS